jgi:thiamine-monophosphate kinase
MGEKSERELVALLERVFGRARRPVLVGIGDDAAVLEVEGRRFVWTVDTSVENVHFRTGWLSLEDVGWRSFHAAVSDVAAMGGIPLAVLSNLIVPRSMGPKAVRALAKGQALAARSLRCPVVGGNLSRGGELSVTTTVLGRVDQPLLRSGARPGDELWLVGDVGLARAGLLWLSREEARASRRGGSTGRAVARCLEAWRRPRALVREGRALRGRARAAIDISDGLSTDAAHLAKASGVRVVIQEPRLRAALCRELEKVAPLLDCDPLELALAGGEDYALLAAGSGRVRPRGARRIGRVEKGRGVFLESDGAKRRIAADGFEHFGTENGRKG